MPTATRTRLQAKAGSPHIPLLPSERIRRFFLRHLRHGKDRWAGRPFVLESWQIDDFIKPVYDQLEPRRIETVTAEGSVARTSAMFRSVREGLLGVAKKNGKSHLGAGLGAYGLVADGYYQREGDEWRWTLEPGREVYNIAGSRPQAKVLFEIARSFVDQDPLLRAMCRLYRDAIEVPETGSVWRVLASDADLLHGPNPSTAIIDEIWVHKNPEMYEALAGAGAARAQPLLIIITTAGYEQATIAHTLYERGRKTRKNRRFYSVWFEAPEDSKIDDLDATKKANPSRWVTKAYLKQELTRARETGNENAFARFHRNQWTSSKEAAIPIRLWRKTYEPPEMLKGEPAIVAVDSAPKRDSTGIAVVQRDEESGIHHAVVSKMAADPESGYLDYDALEQLLRELCVAYDVQRLLVDRYNMVRSMLILQSEGLPVEEFPQSDALMVPASMNLYELVVGDRLRLGPHEDLRREVQAAAKQITERGWRFTKRKSSGLIDGLVALTMATYIAEKGVQEEQLVLPSLYA
ncbi:MAG: terminase large subunit domain-containing protein [Actinomycetota bacterium]